MALLLKADDKRILNAQMRIWFDIFFFFFEVTFLLLYFSKLELNSGSKNVVKMNQQLFR